jgi:hypothetical protein
VIAALVFFNRGEDHEYAYYLAQAQASVNNAGLMQTTELQREGWDKPCSGWIRLPPTRTQPKCKLCA